MAERLPNLNPLSEEKRSVPIVYKGAEIQYCPTCQSVVDIVGSVIRCKACGYITSVKVAAASMALQELEQIESAEKAQLKMLADIKLQKERWLAENQQKIKDAIKREYVEIMIDVMIKDASKQNATPPQFDLAEALASFGYKGKLDCGIDLKGMDSLANENVEKKAAELQEQIDSEMQQFKAKFPFFGKALQALVEIQKMQKKSAFLKEVSSMVKRVETSKNAIVKRFIRPLLEKGITDAEREKRMKLLVAKLE